MISLPLQGLSILKWMGDPDNHKYVLYVVLILLALLALQQCNKVDDLQHDLQVSDSNLMALADDLEQRTTDYQTTLAEKGALQVEKQRLKRINEDLSKKVNRLQKPLTITDLGYKIVRDTVVVSDVYVSQANGAYTVGFRHREVESWGRRVIEGRTKFRFSDSSVIDPITTITRDIIETQITTGFRQRDDGMLVTYAESPDPNIEFTQVDGAVLDPNKFARSERSPWSVGPLIGYGVTPDFNLTPFVGVGVSYSLFR